MICCFEDSASAEMLSRSICVLLACITLAAANRRHDINGKTIKGLAKEELAVTDSGFLGESPRTPKSSLIFRCSLVRRSRSFDSSLEGPTKGFTRYYSASCCSHSHSAAGEAPYSMPKSRRYNTTSGPVAGKINVHLVTTHRPLTHLISIRHRSLTLMTTLDGKSQLISTSSRRFSS